MTPNIDSILDAAEQQQASDVFLQENEAPRLKVNEQIIVLGEEPLSLAEMTAFWQACGANATGGGDMDRDSGFVSRTHTRYRVSLHRTMGRLGGVLRRIKTIVPGLKALGAPEWLMTRWGANELAELLSQNTFQFRGNACYVSDTSLHSRSTGPSRRWHNSGLRFGCGRNWRET